MITYTDMSEMLARIQRDYRGLEINENDAIEWMGDALESVKIYSVLEEATHFAEVKNKRVTMPEGLQYIIQIAKDNEWASTSDSKCTPTDILSSINTEEVNTGCQKTHFVEVDCNGYALDQDQVVKTYQAKFDLNNYYSSWIGSSIYNRRYSLVKLADHTFFKSIVCQPEENPYQTDFNYNDRRDEYGIQANNILFSFDSGYVAISYLKTATGEDGLPQVPDHRYMKEALSYYVIYKQKQREAYLHKEGARTLASDAYRMFEKYIGMFKSYAKMPKGHSEYLAIREQGLYILPDLSRPYGFWGGSTDPETRRYTRPRSYYGK